VTMPGHLMQSEIGEQPEVLQRIIDSGLDDVRAVAAAIRERSPRFVLFAARGTSDHACLYAKYLVEIRLGLPAGLVSPSTMTSYGSRPDLRDVLVVVVSQSGGSPDLIETATTARACGAIVLAVTNAPNSPLAAAADLHLDVHAGVEHAVAATKSYTAELFTLWLLIDALKGGNAQAGFAVPAAAAVQVERKSEMVELAQRYRFADRLILTGRGYSYPTVREAALKLMETSYVAALAFSGADLMHGPLAMIDQNSPVLAVVPEGIGAVAMRPVLERLQSGLADLTIFGGASSLPFATSGFRIEHKLPEDLSPLVDIIALQHLACEMAIARGFDPDAPRGLLKMTQTW
jgi:glucosamine--fructose-6-phosphate aminotransferase (isomerizing)